MTDPTDLSAPLERLVSRFARMVRQVGRGRGLADPDLDELLQEVRIRLWRARGGPGQTIELANDPTAELKKGKTAARYIDWVAGSGDVSEAGKAPFQEAMTKLAASLRETGGGQYRIDLYMDQRYDETAVSMFGPSRMAEIQAALSSAGVSPAIVLMGKAKRDKHPRMELVKVK
jgi:hypothetical protein